VAEVEIVPKCFPRFSSRTPAEILRENTPKLCFLSEPMKKQNGTCCKNSLYNTSTRFSVTARNKRKEFEE
jgi:hypothetical protein